MGKLSYHHPPHPLPRYFGVTLLPPPSPSTPAIFWGNSPTTILPIHPRAFPLLHLHLHCHIIWFLWGRDVSFFLFSLKILYSIYEWVELINCPYVCQPGVSDRFANIQISSRTLHGNWGYFVSFLRPYPCHAIRIISVVLFKTSSADPAEREKAAQLLQLLERWILLQNCSRDTFSWRATFISFMVYR